MQSDGEAEAIASTAPSSKDANIVASEWQSKFDSIDLSWHWLDQFDEMYRRSQLLINFAHG
jgi:hypothetical protein